MFKFGSKNFGKRRRSFPKLLVPFLFEATVPPVFETDYLLCSGMMCQFHIDVEMANRAGKHNWFHDITLNITH